MLTMKEFQGMNAGLQTPDGVEHLGTPYAVEEGDDLSHKLEDALQDKMGVIQGGDEDLSRKLNELTAEFDRLNARHKHVLEERDNLSRQVAEFRRKAAEQPEAPALSAANAGGHDVSEEIKALVKLINEECVLRDAAKGPLSEDPYTRHGKFLDVLLKIVNRP